MSTRTDRWEHITPEDAGVPSEAVLGLIERIEEENKDIHGFALIRKGKVFAEGYFEPYDKDSPHLLYSCSKSFTSLCAGIAADEGKLDLHASVLSFFPEITPENPGENKSAMTVHHLLNMNTGHDTDTLGQMIPSPCWAKAFLDLPVEHAPGTKFVYNNGATYMVSAIIQRTTGATLWEYAQEKLFKPTGMTPSMWERNLEGVSFGFSGLFLTVRDMAKLGLLILGKGVWDGRRVVSEAYLCAATSRLGPSKPDGDPNWMAGYGYQFWQCAPDMGGFRADGMLGQYVYMLPEKELICVFTACMKDMGWTLNALRDEILTSVGEPLPENTQAHGALLDKIGRLGNLEVRRDAIPAFMAGASDKEARIWDEGSFTVRYQKGPQAGLTIKYPTFRGDAGIRQFTAPVTPDNRWRMVSTPPSEDDADGRFAVRSLVEDGNLIVWLRQIAVPRVLRFAWSAEDGSVRLRVYSLAEDAQYETLIKASV